MIRLIGKLVDDALGAGGIIKGAARGIDNGDDLSDIAKYQRNAERIEAFLEDHDDIEMNWELNTPMDAVVSVFNFIGEILD